ncbi:MAG TPA: hypothetical protein VLD67_12920 [Vicinamibacterales bacterium]|nr:hypothetical protein [Vicinamibacterales bacterium]
MKRWKILVSIVIGLASTYTLLAAPGPLTQPPKVEMPKPGVPEIMTLEGEFVRAAYNNEGYVILGYRVANQSIGEPWMLLEVGATVRQGRPNYKLTRAALSLETPDGKTVPMPSNRDYQNVDLRALEMRSTVVRDSINYFPPGASTACRIGFFSEVGSRAMSYDEVELSWQRACLGRLYFNVPGGIQYGQHWLNVKFANTLVRVPFRILTDEERKTLSRNYKDIKKQVDEAFRKKSGSD